MQKTVPRSSYAAMRHAALSLVLLLICDIAVDARQAQPPIVLPLDVIVRHAPVPFAADGKTHLVYELTVTNLGGDDCVLESVAINAPDAHRAAEVALATYSGQTLIDAVARPGLAALRGEQKLSIGAAQRAVVYVWVTLPRGAAVPQALQHVVTVKLGPSQHSLSTIAARISITGKPHTIAPPLRGANWIAANGPSNASAHRRAIIPIEGAARVPQRFAIDWLQVGPDGRNFDGDPTDNKSYRAYGEEAIAVSDGVITAIKDGIPENTPGPTSRAVPITLDTIAGNHVILDIGGGVFAFYAHLQPGSLKVKLGDKVRRGQAVGLVGNSGNSTEPHLHFHLSDANSPLGGEGLPYAFSAFEIEGTMGAPQGGSWPSWTRLPAPEKRALEMPLQNAVVRFGGGL